MNKTLTICQPYAELIIRETKTGFVASCSCGQAIHRASGCNGSGYWYARAAADEKFAEHRERLP